MRIGTVNGQPYEAVSIRPHGQGMLAQRLSTLLPTPDPSRLQKFRLTLATTHNKLIVLPSLERVFFDPRSGELGFLAQPIWITMDWPIIKELMLLDDLGFAIASKPMTGQLVRHQRYQSSFAFTLKQNPDGALLFNNTQVPPGIPVPRFQWSD